MAAVEPRGSMFAVPTPIRELFKLFPLITLPSEPLPARAPERIRERPRFYVFAREKDVLGSLPSFNPSCLKWQVQKFLHQDLLKSVKRDVLSLDVDILEDSCVIEQPCVTLGSSPFPTTTFDVHLELLPPLPVTGDKIGRYAREKSSINIPNDPPRVEAYSALLTQNIRPAWLYALYLLPSNLPLLTTLYLPSSPLLQLPVLQSLLTAANSEILKTTRRSLISPSQLLADAETALRALSTLLAADDWFFSPSEPGLFDAEVFAYTHLILDDSLGWCDNSLAQCVSKFDNLVAHRQRLYERCWPEKHQQ
ncbi:hypothetical protein PT974_05808 [Cladobotryum mycophilum]|uniref:Metaxin glutathione S-transferase domain-containing protein n=1 Tax=Cladobotryum mycophilum TaxID=491253 RepID=A0ABR0SK23_9HYPO